MTLQKTKFKGTYQNWLKKERIRKLDTKNCLTQMGRNGDGMIKVAYVKRSLQENSNRQNLNQITGIR